MGRAEDSKAREDRQRAVELVGRAAVVDTHTARTDTVWVLVREQGGEQTLPNGSLQLAAVGAA